MAKLRKTALGLALAGALLLPTAGCTLEMRDAVMSGVFDFVSGTVTDTLANLLPISAALGEAQEQADNS